MTKPGWRVPSFLDGVVLPPMGQVLLDPHGVTWRVLDIVDEVANGTRRARVAVNGGSSFKREMTPEQLFGWEVLR